jgi:hypothetical protein
MALTPFWKGLSKRLCRDDMFPFKAFGSLRVLPDCIATAHQIDLTPGIGTATVELGFVSSKDLCQEFLRAVEGIDRRVLGKDGGGCGKDDGHDTTGNTENEAEIGG